MVIGTRLRKLRERKGLGQGDVERLTGIKRCYTSRVEHGHTVPGLANLQKYAAALGVPMYRLFYEGEELPPLPESTPSDTLGGVGKRRGKKEAEAKFFLKLKKLLAKVGERDKQLILGLMQKFAAGEK
jgi:transcriptional regulator with XRE-family HTH domain